MQGWLENPTVDAEAEFVEGGYLARELHQLENGDVGEIHGYELIGQSAIMPLKVSLK